MIAYRSMRRGFRSIFDAIILRTHASLPPSSLHNVRIPRNFVNDYTVLRFSHYLSTKVTPSKPRLSNPNLRPLFHFSPPENLHIVPGLLSPSSSPAKHTGLRSLSLAPIDETTASASIKHIMLRLGVRISPNNRHPK